MLGGAEALEVVFAEQDRQDPIPRELRVEQGSPTHKQTISDGDKCYEENNITG